MVFRSVLKFAISIGCIVAVWGYLEYDRDASAERLAEAMKLRSIRVLRGADSKEELTAAVGELGVVIPLPDEEFVAIRYRDVHGNPNVSTAVAKDSGGKWWHSREHFCGRLKSLSRLLDEHRLEASQDRKEHLARQIFEQHPLLSELANTESIDDARLRLKELGFRELTREELAAAVDSEDLSADESSGWRAQKRHDAGDFVRTAVTLERAFLDQHLVVDRVNSQEPLGHGSSRRDAVDWDVVRSKLVGQAARVFVHGGFGQAVNRSVRPPRATGDAADRDDAAGLSLDHLRSHRATRKDRREQVAVHHALQIVEPDVEAVVVLGAAAFADSGARRADVASGTADQRVDASPLCPDLAHNPLDFGLVSRVAPHGEHFVAGLTQNRRCEVLHRGALVESRRAVLPRSVDGDECSLPRQFDRHFATQAA